MKRIEKGDRDKVAIGVLSATDLLELTYGANGKAVMIEGEDGHVDFVDDGASVCRALASLAGEREAIIGARLLLTACEKVLHTVGDGTTTTALLARECMLKLANEESLQMHMADFVDDFIESVKKTNPSEAELKAIARLSTNDESLAEVVGKAVGMIGAGGQVRVRVTDSGDEIKIVPGFSWMGEDIVPRPYLSAGINRFELPSCGVLLINGLVNGPKELISALNVFHRMDHDMKGNDNAVNAKKGRRPLLLICSGMSDDCMQICIANTSKFTESKGSEGLPVFVVRSSGLEADDLLDLAEVTGATVMGFTGVSLSRLDPACFGSVDSAALTPESASLVLTEFGTTKRDALLVKLEEAEAHGARITRLRVGNMTILVNGDSDSERSRRNALAEDAILACQSAIRNGFVSGGGQVLWELQEHVGTLGVQNEALREVFQGLLLTLFGDDTETACATFAHGGQFDMKTQRPVEAGTFLEPALLYPVAFRVALSLAIEINNAGAILVRCY